MKNYEIFKNTLDKYIQSVTDKLTAQQHAGRESFLEHFQEIYFSIMLFPYANPGFPSRSPYS